MLYLLLLVFTISCAILYKIKKCKRFQPSVALKEDETCAAASESTIPTSQPQNDIMNDAIDLEIEEQNEKSNKKINLSEAQIDNYFGCSSSKKPKRKPCKNCSCGAKNVDLENFTSACGNCGKGDEYRCDSCPHLGKPSF